MLQKNYTKVKSVDKATDPSTLFFTLVSAGRGLKGPENWGMIEELAEVLGAATACSKPVSDLGWRPHGEHVGQTGKACCHKFIHSYWNLWSNTTLSRCKFFQSESCNQY